MAVVGGRCHFQLLVHSYLMCSTEDAVNTRTKLLQVRALRRTPTGIAKDVFGRRSACVRACMSGTTATRCDTRGCGA